MKKALVTGVTGQDGSYLADLLLEKGYEVYGLIRRSSTDNRWRIKQALGNGLVLVDGDVTDGPCLQHIFQKHGPFDECYNLAAQSDVGLSWKQPAATANITGLGCLNVIEAIRVQDPNCRFYQASTSELFGNSTTYPQDEHTILAPRSPYGCAKAFAHYITINYRESYNLFACCGILFNHESPRRGDNFVTQKIVKAAKKIAAGEQEFLYLGNLDSERDWGHAKDYVEAMWMMLQQETPEEYVISSGKCHTVQEFCDETFSVLGLNYKDHVKVAQEFVRPAEVNKLCGNPQKATDKLGWYPNYGFNAMIMDMLFYD